MSCSPPPPTTRRRTAGWRSDRCRWRSRSSPDRRTTRPSPRTSPRGEVRGDGRVVLRSGEDRDRQRHRSLRQPAVLLLVVGGGGLQDIVERRLVLGAVDVQDRRDLLVRQVGGGVKRGQDL